VLHTRELLPDQRACPEVRVRSDISLWDLLEAGILSPGTILVWRRSRVTHRAKLLATGQIELATGGKFDTPSGAAAQLNRGRAVDGWLAWKVGHEYGPRLDEIRKDLQRARPEIRARSAISLRDLLEAGILSPGTILVWRRSRSSVTHKAKLLATGQIELATGGKFDTPSGAATELNSRPGVDGWRVWRVGNESGPRLDEIRKNLLESR
jgi:hypothetical protein